MSKIHITSFLRPRGRFKSIEDEPQPTTTISTQTTSTPTINTTSQQDIVPATNSSTSATTANPTTEFELIPTLQFVAKAPHGTASVGTQHVADESNSNNVEDFYIISDSSHTYVINSAANAAAVISTTKSESTDTKDLQQQEADFSLLTDDSSFVDEPTSSISIVMDNLGKMTSATTTETTTTTADEVPAPTTATTSATRNSSRSAMTTITTPSSDQSIEEEIEEAIELSVDTEEDEHVAGNSLGLSEAAAYAAELTTDKSESVNQRDDHGESSLASEDKFKIDDDQLSGGKLAQHFVLEDDEDEDDDDNFDDLDVSLPMEKRLEQSAHLESDLVAEEQKESLTNESTADDVSDLLEEPRQEKEPESESSGADFDFPLPEVTVTQDSNDIAVNSAATHTNNLEQLNHSKKPEADEAVQNAELMSGASSEHIEQDHSIEEVVQTDHSIEMTLDDKDLSSLNPSFDINNHSLVDRLLADTIEEKNVNQEEVNISKESVLLNVKDEKEANVDSSKSAEIKLVTDLDKTKDHSIEYQTKDTEKSSKPLDIINLSTKEANIITNKPAKVLETLLLQPLDAFPAVETLQLQPLKLKNTNYSFGAENLASSRSKDALEAEISGKQKVSTMTVAEAASEIHCNDDDDDDNSMELMKLRILAMKLQQKEPNLATNEVATNVEPAVRQMERVPLNEMTKDALEDITEESERNSLSTAEEARSLSLEKEEKSDSTMKSESKVLQGELAEQQTESIVSLNMIKMLEHKVGDLESMLASKDTCLAAMNLQLESAQRRESLSGAPSNEQPASGRDTSSLVTNSTEYRTFQEDFGGGTTDFYLELTKRDELIAKLTDSLQQSMNMRENLQAESEKLNTEIVLLRKQLTEAMDTMRKPFWPRDQESNGGQRISEISMDLISESDDDLNPFLTDNEDKYSRNSRERQLSIPRQMEFSIGDPAEPPDWSQTPFSKQIEQFQKYLTPSEVRLFFMVQKKFDDYLSQELEKCKMKCEHEHKVLQDQLESEKLEKQQEIERLQQLQVENTNTHSKEMEELRKYFETKCADLEKQYSDDVFSQKSQHLNVESSSECSSDQDQMPEEIVPVSSARVRSKESSPRKRSRAELLLSPSHRQMTPLGDAFVEDSKISAEIADLKGFYQNKIHEMQRITEEQIRKLTEKVKYYERRYPDDDFMPMPKAEGEVAQTVPTANTTQPLTTHAITQDANSSLIIIDQDELNLHNESQVIQKIIEEYERRLQEQLALAREDIVHELEQQIQTLLSETTTDDHWPPELILLREKFTAKSQLEIAQLQIKHEEEMSRLRLDYEKQLNRKNKRNLSFDSARDFEQIISDRDNLRELSKSFRHVLAGLAKCVANCEDDLNATLVDEVHRLLANNRVLEEQHMSEPDALALNISAALLNASFNSVNPAVRLVPDVQNLLEVVEDPSLLEYISQRGCDLTEDFDLKDCLERLKGEAAYLLQLSEDFAKRHRQQRVSGSCDSSGAEKNDSCCEAEDGLKMPGQQHKFLRAYSFNEQQLSTYPHDKASSHPTVLNSLPVDFSHEYSSTMGGNASELNFQVHELKNRLVKSEADRSKLQQELENTISRNAELGQELEALRDQLSQLSQLNSLNSTEYAEGYGLGSLKSPQRLSAADKSSASFSQLQEKARNLLSTPTQPPGNNDTTAVLLQMIEDFCREGDKVVEGNKKDRDDLQSQIDTADKQLKATRQFLEEQAADREQERDEYLREIERLKAQLRDKEKERSTYANASVEFEQMDTQIRDLTQKLQDTTARRDKFEVELKASIDKIFVLREIISELETQVETKTLNERVLGEKVNELQKYVATQTSANETLQNEVQIKCEIAESYEQRIKGLEEKLQNMRPSAEQSMVLDQVVDQLRDIENTLDQKTKALESLHNSSNSCSISATEDISVHGTRPFASLPVGTATAAVNSPTHIGSPLHPSPRQHSLTMEGVQRIADKLSKHTRVEEAAVKRIKDLEMQVSQMRAACVELQHERDSLHERMGEQSQRIAALQSRLEEQRQRAEELQRAGTADLNVRVHDLQTEVQNLRETLSARDKQIVSVKQQLEKSKLAIDRLEAELSVQQQPDRSLVERLQTELKQKTEDLLKLKDKMKNEMIAKLALPDLMETILAEKNEEIDFLREQLESKEKELNASGKGVAKDEASGKLSARTLSDIVSITEFDEPAVVRRAAAQNAETPLLVPEGSGGFLQQTMETSKEAVADLTHRRTEDLSGLAPLQAVNTFEHPHYFQDPNVLASGQSGATITPVLVPRQINFSALTEDSKLKTPNVMPTPDTNEKVKEKEKALAEKDKELLTLEEELVATQLRLGGVQEELDNRQREFEELKKECENLRNAQAQIVEKSAEIEQILKEQQELKKDHEAQKEELSKAEKNIINYRENEEKNHKRIADLEQQLQHTLESEREKHEGLRKQLQTLKELHEQCAYTVRVADERKLEVEELNGQVKIRDERLNVFNAKLLALEEIIGAREQQISTLELEVEKLRLQLHSDNSSKQFSVDEIAQQVEKELNYSAQLDSNILRAIESEEENNLDLKQCHKANQTKNEAQGTDDENFTGERELLNQLEALRSQIAMERECGAGIRAELHNEKQHSQEIQEQDALIIEAMRKRLEAAMEQEDELHKQLDIERERCERLQTQLTALQRAESRRNSLLLLKSPTESPRKARSLIDGEFEVAERLRSEIKLLSAQNERERERSADVQRSSERERQRYETELQERIEYCDKLKREMEKLVKEKDNAEQECEHLQERLTLQTQEIESLETRLATLQEAETRRSTRRERQQKENAQMLAELQELKTQLLAAETERDNLTKAIGNLRSDIERSVQRESKLAEALANANANIKHAATADATVPQQFLQKMKEINTLLAENTQENRQMAETVQYLVEERRQLQKKCEELEGQLSGTGNVAELEERCNHLLGRYLRVESHRKALVYQKRYLKISLQSYQESEQRALATMRGGHMQESQRNTKKLFKTVALAIIAIQRMKYIGRIWHTGKRIVSKSVFTITQQKRTQPPVISCTAISSTSPTTNGVVGALATSPHYVPSHNHNHYSNNNIYNGNGHFNYLAPLQAPALLSDCNPSPAVTAAAANVFDWSRAPQ